VSRSLDTWLGRARGFTIQYGHMLQLKNNIYPGARGLMRGGHSSALTEADCVTVIDEYRKRWAGDGYYLSGDHLGHGDWTKSGREFLSRKKIAAALPPELAAVLPTIEFRFAGFYVMDFSGYRPWICPTYRILSPETATRWEYSPAPWTDNSLTAVGRLNMKELEPA